MKVHEMILFRWIEFTLTISKTNQAVPDYVILHFHANLQLQIQNTDTLTSEKFALN